VPKTRRPEKTTQESQIQLDVPSQQQPQGWIPATRVLFRFWFAYLTLFILATQISGSMIPNLSFYYRGMGRLWPMRDVTFWVGRHLFGATSLDDPNMGGEPLFFWIQLLWLFVVAVFVTAAWSIWDRNRDNYDGLHRWFRLFVRFALAAAMFEYGMTKVIPTQFPPPSLETLVTPVSNLTLSALLWTSIGSAPAYEIFTGCVEMVGGILLLLPRTTLLGAVISLAAMMQVFALNMTYDIALKLVSFHLILLALFLIAPDARRLIAFFWRNESPAPPVQQALFSTPSANRLALYAQIACGVYLVGMYAYINIEFWNHGGARGTHSALYGIWNVEELSINGDVHPAELNDYDRRWRRVIFDTATAAVFQRTDDSFAHYGATIDAAARTIVLTKGGSKRWKATFAFEQPSVSDLILTGEMDGYKIRTKLRLVEFDTLRLLNSNFRWVHPQE
jgi:hypothetical protein